MQILKYFHILLVPHFKKLTFTGTHDKRINLPLQETKEIQVQSLALEDPLEKEMETHSSILSWKIPWTEEPGGVTQSRT